MDWKWEVGGGWDSGGNMRGGLDGVWGWRLGSILLEGWIKSISTTSNMKRRSWSHIQTNSTAHVAFEASDLTTAVYELQLHCIRPLYLGTSPHQLSCSCFSASLPSHVSAKGSRLARMMFASVVRSACFSMRSIRLSRM